MKNKLLIIIAGIIISVTLGILIILNQPQQGNQEQNYAIKIVGLKDNYKINEPVEFTVNVQGYGIPCGAIMAKILNYSNQHDNSIISWGELLQCRSAAKATNFSINMSVNSISLAKSIGLDREGSYYVVAYFDQFRGLNKTTEKQIVVSKSNE